MGDPLVLKGAPAADGFGSIQKSPGAGFRSLKYHIVLFTLRSGLSKQLLLGE